MGEALSIDLTEQQRQMLLRGLRYVRSAVALEIREPNPQVEADRASQYGEISRLVEQLEHARPADAPARV